MGRRQVLGIDVEAVLAAATAVAAAAAGLTQLIRTLRRRDGARKELAVLTGEIRDVTDSPRVVVVVLERVFRRRREPRWTASILAEATDGGVSLMRWWTNRAVDGPYVQDIIGPLERSDEALVLTSELRPGVLRDTYEGHGTAATWLRVILRESADLLWIVSVHRRTEEPLTALQRSRARDFQDAIPAALGR